MNNFDLKKYLSEGKLYEEEAILKSFLEWKCEVENIDFETVEKDEKINIYNHELNQLKTQLKTQLK
jgi:hypothetical protein